jgi:hypothetical protein
MKNEMLTFFAESLVYGGFLVAMIAGWLYGVLSLLAALITP